MAMINLSRISLGMFPTPLHELPRLSAALGGPRIFIKREDLTGLAMGGNKTRKLEFIMADVKEKGYDAIISTAGSQSNWCAQAAAAARKLGMEAAFVLFRGIHPETQGNLLLHNLMHSQVKILEGDMEIIEDKVNFTGDYGSTRYKVMEEMADEFRERGRNPVQVLTIDITSHVASLGVAAFASAMEEIWEQAKALKIDVSHLVLAQGSGGTAAGLLLGARLLEIPLEVIGISVSRPKAEGIGNVVLSANATAKLLGKNVSISPDKVIVYEEYIGEGYGLMTDGCRQAVRLMAETEGIILDPVYTGKALAGLIDLIRKGRFTSSDTVVFIHTGGLPALFAYGEELGCDKPFKQI